MGGPAWIFWANLTPCSLQGKLPPSRDLEPHEREKVLLDGVVELAKGGRGAGVKVSDWATAYAVGFLAPSHHPIPP
jgi:hypothetical protein